MLFMNLVYLVWSQVRQGDDGVEYAADQTRFMPAEQSLVLLSELPEPNTTDVALPVSDESVPAFPDPNPENEVPAVTTPAVNEPELHCEIASGFADQGEAEAFIAEISDKGVVGTLQLEQEQISSTWWVHLPPFKSQLEAQSVIDELVAKGIDNFYMRTGELAGGISLGVFSREESATTAQTELRSRGYETSIREVPRYVSKAYVTLEESDPGSFTSSEWLAFLAAKTNLEAIEKPCETIAR